MSDILIVDGERFRRRLLLPAQGEQTTDFLLEDVELPRGDGEAVVGRSRRAAATMEVDGELRPSDGVAEFMGEAGGELPEEPLPLAGHELAAERLERGAHPIHAGHEPADLVRVGGFGRGQRVAELATGDPRHVSVDRADPAGEAAGGAQ